jgi:hypothetical protein
MNNSLKSLEVKNEVINLIKEKFKINFNYSFNDLYKVKDNGLVRRLKGYIYYDRKNNFLIDKVNFNNVVVEIDDYLKSLNYEGFEIRLKKRKIENLRLIRDSKYVNLSLDECRKELEFEESVLILSIKFKNI